MRGRAITLCLLLGACGRLGFDAQLPGGPGPDANGNLTLSYPRAELAAVLGVTAIALTPTISDPSARFSVEPALPTGLVLASDTGELAGVPSTVADQITYTIVATTTAATASFALELTVLPGFVVDTTSDAPDANGGADATCATATGMCSLRAAIQTVNTRATKQLVLLDATTYPLDTALDPIVRDVVIVGQGAKVTSIRAATLHGLYRAFSLATSSTLALRDLEIRDFGGSNGGALSVTAGTLEVDRCEFASNWSPGSGGVLFINGGARATLARSMFHGNKSLGGSGGGWGGVVDGEGPGTTIVVLQSAATGNSTAWGSFAHITTGTTLRLESSTLYGNTSTTAGTLATPGGIYTLVNATIVNNTNTNPTPNSAGIYLYSVPCSYTVTNTLVAFNLDVNGAELDCNRRDLGTTITSGGGNLFSDSAGNCAAYFTATGDRLATDPLLDPAGAADHGGATPTILVQPTSPAIDGGNDAACPAIDQRGLARPRGAHCDIGAVELP